MTTPSWPHIGLAARIMLSALDGDDDQERQLVDDDPIVAYEALTLTVLGLAAALYGEKMRDRIALLAIAADLDGIEAAVVASTNPQEEP